jgi:septum site-determining protein MinD
VITFHCAQVCNGCSPQIVPRVPIPLAPPPSLRTLPKVLGSKLCATENKTCRRRSIRIDLFQHLIRDKRLDTLWLLPASQTRDKDALTADGVARVIAQLRQKFDWVICDSPAGIERGAMLAMRHADAAVIVTNPEVSSVRESDRIIGLLDAKTEKAEKGEAIEKHLLITRYDAVRAGKGEMLSIEDVLEILSVPLLGIVPESQEVLRASNIGAPITLCNASSAPARAYCDAMRRLKGDNVPMTIPSDPKHLFGKLFRRRAA